MSAMLDGGAGLRTSDMVVSGPLSRQQKKTLPDVGEDVDASVGVGEKEEGGREGLQLAVTDTFYCSRRVGEPRLLT